MQVCPTCGKPVSSNAVACPNCQTVLKAHGHPGMTLHRAQGDQILCPTCVYEADNSCNFPQRPQAKTCTLYQNIEAMPALSPQEIYTIPWWRKVGRGRIALALLIGISLIIALL